MSEGLDRGICDVEVKDDVLRDVLGTYVYLRLGSEGRTVMTL